MTAFLSLPPQFAATAAEINGPTGAQGLGIRLGVHPGDHQHLAAGRVLRHGGDEASVLAEVGAGRFGLGGRIHKLALGKVGHSFYRQIDGRVPSGAANRAGARLTTPAVGNAARTTIRWRKLVTDVVHRRSTRKSCRCAALRSRGPLRVNDSLSIIIPVRDAEATLAEQVHHLLDLLPDLTSSFEIVVVDDGSTDHTPELARDLARQYPQLRLIRHQEMRGRAVAVKTGLASAQGQTVLVKEDFATVSPTDLRR